MLRRIVSLLPAATEIVGALGMMDDMVGVSHECNYPASAQTKPRITGCEITDDRFSSAEIDRWVSQKLSAGEDLFVLDETKLRELQPDLILTQRLCDVCAPAYGSVMALAETLPHRPTVLNEILAQLIHPELFAGAYPERGVKRLAAVSPLSCHSDEATESIPR